MRNKLLVDVSDLLEWLGRVERVSGIQRVGVELVRHGLPPDGMFVRAALGMWQSVPDATMRDICECAASGSATRADLGRLLAQIRPHGVGISPGDVLYLPGAFWVTGGLGRSVRWAKAQGARVTALFYDMIPVNRPELCGGVGMFQNVRGVAKVLDGAQAISEYTAKEVSKYMELFVDRSDLSVTVHPLAHQFSTAPAASSERVNAASARPFVLCVGTVNARKNQEMLYRVWKRLYAVLGESCPRLVLAGAHVDVDAFVSDVRSSGALGDRVIFIEDASDPEIAALYDRCMFTVFPSLYEGWGLPVGESLARGKVCVASSATAIPEVGGDLALYADPENENENYEVIVGLLRHEPRLRALTGRVVAEFRPRSWDTVFEGIFDDLGMGPARSTRPAPPPPPRVRLYGQTTGESSFAQVTRGMERALSAAGELAGTCPLSVGEDERSAPPGADAPLALNCGAPTGLMTAHRVGQHRSHWLLLAPNSEGLPKGLVETLTTPSSVLPSGMLSGLVAPSGWAASVLRRCFPDHPVVVCPHGVTPDIHCVDRALRDTARSTFRSGQFSVLHMTSTDAERKGTRILLAAWKRLKEKKEIPATAKLYVVMNPMQMSKVRWWCADLGLTEADVAPAPGLLYNQHDVAAMYGTMHAICQPSRGEGFGLVPLEALACGVPVIATACTGHAEYLGSRPPGSVIIDHGELAPVDDFMGAVAPSVEVEDVRSAIERTFNYWESVTAQAEMNAAALAREWSWENKSAPAIRRMLQEAGC